ncbi:hypothetical protein [Spirochaeta africana]|uniref:Uncharacterized protein n=1 Tax=Spirochaeta africana (strain ATCC 700263 / DSM 8902 / Z-7692) TaxID=889378 RepID=H9UGW7_SPIAZ|nr:hypothetical protein [Spirochaeta africana]AFG36760.1 hypothetical protein Spiaf_0660 [Spirochaeta africana DSM 8902]
MAALQTVLAVSTFTAAPAVVLPILPVPRGSAPQPLLLHPEVSDSVLPGELVLQQPAELGMYGVVQGVHYFLDPVFPAASQKRDDTILRPHGLQQRGWPEWVTSGPYQYFTGTSRDYTRVQEIAARYGILLPRTSADPAIMPFLLSRHEDRLLDAVAAEYAG